MNAIGFGENATGGTNPYTVTTLQDDGAGSLREALSVEGRLITFLTSGTIRLASPLRVLSNTTILGRGIKLLNDSHGLLPRADVSNLIIRDLTMQSPLSFGAPRDPTETQQYGNRITLTGPIRDVWIDGCKFYQVGGKGITLWDGTTGVTISNCKFLNSFYGILAGCTHGMPQSKWPRMEVTVHHCLFSGVKRRSPKAASGVHMHTFNNVIDNWGPELQDYGSGSSSNAQHLIENNIYDAGPRGNPATAFDCGRESDDSGLGFIRATGNVMSRCKGQARQPTAVFKPPYQYKLDKADAVLKLRVSS